MQEPADDQPYTDRSSAWRLTSVVVFVHNLDESVDFYRELLSMEVTVRTTTAALLMDLNDFQAYVRAVGPKPPTRWVTSARST